MSNSNLSKHLSWLLWTRPYLPPSDPTQTASTTVESPVPLDNTDFTGGHDENDNRDVNSVIVPARLDATQDQTLVWSPPARRTDQANNSLASPNVLSKTESNMARLQVAPRSSVKPRLVQSTSFTTSDVNSAITTLTDQYHAQFRSDGNGT